MISIHRVVSVTATVGTALLSIACNEIADIREPILDLSVNDTGQRDFVVQISTGESHTCALLYTGKVKCWGDNSAGQSGLGEQGFQGMGLKLPPVNLGNSEMASFIDAGDYHTCAVLGGGRLKCWGGNDAGQLGLGDTESRGKSSSQMGDNLPVVNVGTDKKVKEVGIGFEYTCVLLTDATVKCWGRNNDGSLGLGNTTSLGTKVGHMGDNLQPVDLGKGFSVHAISVGSIHACALSENGDVKCWGSNMDGRLGQGDGFSHGSGPGEMGDALLPVDLGVGVKAKAISAGYDHTCALLLDNRVKCWGNNDYGQLGQGDIINRGDGSGEMGENLLAVDLGTGKTAKAIIAGGQYSCAWLSDDGVKCWGRNDTGQLGQGNTMTLGDESVEMGDYLLPVLLGTDQALKQIDGIHFHSCVLRIDGTVKCWGYNLYTQLGLVDFGTVGDAPGQMGDNLPTLNLVSPK